jgi:hypothetical protein
VSVDAQDQVERVERELQRTRELMERVLPQVKESNIPLAVELFERAVGLQTKARVQFESAREAAFPGRQLSQSLQLTLQARDLTKRAGQVLRDQLSYEEKAKRAIERAEVLMERLRERAGAGDTRRVRVALEEAERQLDAAERHYRDRNFEVALRLAESALKLMDSVPGGADNPQTRADRLEREIRRTRDLLDRAREHEGSLPEGAAQGLPRATQLLEQAERAFQAGDLERAHQLNGQCRTLLRTLLDQAGARVTEQDIERALNRFDGDLQRLRDRVGDNPSSEVRDLIDQAIQARGAAVEMANRGEYDRALGRLRAAFDMLVRARRLADARDQ